MLIRIAKQADLPTIVKLWKDMMDLHYNCNPIFIMKENATELYSSYALSVINDKSKRAIVAEKDGQVVGYAFCEISEEPPVHVEPLVGNITELSVDQNYRRKGIGAQLFSECKKWFKEHKINRIDIMVARDNKISQGFWAKVGFSPYFDKMFLDV